MIEIVKLTQYKVMHVLHKPNINECYADVETLVLGVNDMMKLHKEIEDFLIKLGAIDKVVVKIE